MQNFHDGQNEKALIEIVQAIPTSSSVCVWHGFLPQPFNITLSSPNSFASDGWRVIGPRISNNQLIRILLDVIPIPVTDDSAKDRTRGRLKSTN